jgi:spectinomycin phosphotransferase
VREKPALHDERIIAQLREAYEIEVARVEFLPLGADFNSAVYRLVTREGAAYFLKLRKGAFDDLPVLVPLFLYEQGIRQVIPPVKTKEGRLWTSLDAYACLLYPFIEGRDGFETSLSDEQWVEFGAALKGVHSAVLPPGLRGRVPVESYSPYWRELTRGFQAQVEQERFADPVAARMAAFMQLHREEIRHVVERAAQLAEVVQLLPLEQVLCHSDIHAGNLLLTSGRTLYIVDWDQPILASKERDLMFIGGGVGGIWNSAREEVLFYQGYGSRVINLTALAYYRYERIVQDVAAFCEQILLGSAGEVDREQGLRYFTSQFLPGEVIEMAQRTDRKLEAGE